MKICTSITGLGNETIRWVDGQQGLNPVVGGLGS